MLCLLHTKYQKRFIMILQNFCDKKLSIDESILINSKMTGGLCHLKINERKQVIEKSNLKCSIYAGDKT